MSDWIKNIFGKIKDLNVSIDSYKQDSIIQSLPTVAYVNKAKKLFEEKQYDKAEELLKKALDISQQDSGVYKYLGKIYESRMKFEDASTYYYESANLNSQDKEIWLRLGMCLLNSNKYEDALDAFEHANKITPLNTDVHTGWGMVLMKMKKYALARDQFNKAAQISKYNYTAILLSAIMEVRLFDYDSAEMKLQFLAKVAPNESSTYEYANLKLLKSDYKAAEEYAKKSISINKQMLPAYFVLGEVYSIQKKYEETEKIFNSAILNDLDNEVLHFEWGKAYVRLFEFSKAKEQFEIAFSKDNDYLNPKIGLALVNAYDNDFTLLDTLKEKHGENVYIQEAMGLEKVAEGRLEDGVELFKKSLRTDCKQSYNYLNIARAYQKLDNKDKTREYFEKFITENSKYVKGFVEYSKWLMGISDYADALRKLRRAEKLDDKNVEILNLLFYSSYRLVKDNICEYNIKETISIADKAQSLGHFEYENEKVELENILKGIQGNN